MKIEEAALTGESVPVNKAAELLSLGGQKDIPLGDRKNMVYMGSTVVYGRGKAVLTGTGMDTEMGKIASALAQAKDEETPLQLKLNQLSKILTVLVLGICAVIFAVGLMRSGFNGSSILNSFMVAVSRLWQRSPRVSQLWSPSYFPSALPICPNETPSSAS